MYVKTKRLELKPICDASLETLIDLLTDDTVKQTYMIPDFACREDAGKLARRIQVMSQDPKRYVAGIHVGGQMIGILNETERSGDCIEVGYAILPHFHNQGYGTEALSATIGYLFTQGFDRVLTGAFEDNIPSLRVMAKSGMEKISRTDEVEYRGKTHCCIYYQSQKR